MEATCLQPAVQSCMDCNGLQAYCKCTLTGSMLNLTAKETFGLSHQSVRTRLATPSVLKSQLGLPHKTPDSHPS